jgi:hypothetical protein
VPHLPKSLLPQALEATREIQRESDRAYALRELVPHLPKSLLPQALEATWQIQNEFYRVFALRALVPVLPESLLFQALEAIPESDRADALCDLVPHLPSLCYPKPRSDTANSHESSALMPCMLWYPFYQSLCYSSLGSDT